MKTTKEIQARLMEMGFDPGPINGVPGPRTDAAITAFKKSVGLRARPYVGPLTLRALFGDYDSGLGWFDAAMAVRGLHEARDTARLRKWFDKAVSWIDPRDVPWCGAFVASAMRKWCPDAKLPVNSLGARQWLGFGRACEPQLGAVLIFWRGDRNGWKGHVGFYYGEDDTHYHVLGGNQSNAVTIARIRKGRLLGARFPASAQQTRRRIRLTPKGVPVTENEA